ncbi:hypothetical protein HY994_06050 [Candidatus Micrarchaeota archaeon]|nr:hypothetical protein [Candidatus Micrarchaeota archaeon]
MELVVRMDGMTQVVLEKLVKDGYFKTKSEVLRAGVLKLGEKYGFFENPNELQEEIKKRSKEKTPSAANTV